MKTKGIIQTREKKQLQNKGNGYRPENYVAGIIKLPKKIHQPKEKRNCYKITFEDAFYIIRSTTNCFNTVFLTPKP